MDLKEAKILELNTHIFKLDKVNNPPQLITSKNKPTGHVNYNDREKLKKQLKCMCYFWFSLWSLL